MARKWVKILGGIIGTLVLLFGAFLSWVWFSTLHPHRVQSASITCKEDPPLLTENDRIKLLNWNVQFMAGKDYYFYYESGPDERPTSEDIEKTTGEVARIIKAEDPDIILLQEVDDGAKRTDHEDQLKNLLELLPPDYCCHSSAFYWKAWFNPHPHIMGSVGMKLSVVSKYKIGTALRHQLALKPDNWLVRQFDLKRAVLEVRLPRETGKDLVVLNTHLTAFAYGSNVRERQVAEIQSLVQERTNDGFPWIVGGDFNLQPPGKEETPAESRVLEPFYAEYQAVPGYDEATGPNEENWYTHFPNDPGIDKPTKTIDYIFLSEEISLGDHYVRQKDTLHISDHLPVVAEIITEGSGLES